METLSNLLHGFAVALIPTNLLSCLVGVAMGTIIGALPGIGPSAGVAILLPLTFGANPTTAMIMLAGIYYGAMYGGTITSVLINTPGESSSVMTTLDGYQMARQGRAGVALGIAALGSFFAGSMGVALLMFFSPLLADFALTFGPPEYFALMVLGFTALAGLSGTSPLKGLISVLLGLLIATVGLDVMTGTSRLTFGRLELLSGIDFLPVAMGLFGLAEVLVGVEKPGGFSIDKADLSLSKVFPRLADWRQSRWPILRGSLLGFIIGVLPGAGATIASFISYALEKRLAKEPERFGRGAIEGVAGPESANNAASAGAMVPLLTLGVPGSATTAIMMGALMMYGLRPGPLLFTQNPDFVWGLIASMYIGNILLVLMNILMIPSFVQILRIPSALLLPLIVVFCVVGVYGLQNSLFDVWLMIFFGLLGYAMKKLDFPTAPLVLALVLGEMLETAFRQSLTMSLGSPAVFLEQPISATLLTLSLLVFLYPLLASLWKGLARGTR
ncbi:MAG: tripartite tricarboxylate transporter permease [Firmicutes bacterium]|nr:tripartite tricarboxylate transporter permease [Bacillota bacterium]